MCDYQQAALLTFVVAVAAIAAFFLNFERSKPALRQIMPTVVLAALAAAGRIIHGIATSLFLTALYLPWKRKLERVKRKYYM